MNSPCPVALRLALLAAALGALPAHLAAQGAPVAPVEINQPLIAYWTFDELFGGACLDASGHGHDAAPEGAAEGLRRVQGLFGAAMSFSGTHLLRVPGKPDFSGVPALSFSAWVLPTEGGLYREIFRKEDGDNRVLFSFQDEFTHLSLGLNIGGYLECDAPITPAQVLDGRWHHAAATFDGEFMRVYLDGSEIGSLRRPGRISAGGPAPGCIGSAGGGECFQGLMDELRIYRAALSPVEITRSYQNGLQALAALDRPAPADEPTLDAPLLAHWTLNEGGLGGVLRDSSGHPGMDVKLQSAVLPMRGVHGNALNLVGRHALATTGGLGVTELRALSLSAWVMPTDLSVYREIFRVEAGDRRILFSFQGSGSLLSLGLDVNGYEECRAPISPEQVMDGQWHHCAAVFDGQAMRVYLDSREIGSLARPGVIHTDGATPGYIGSLGGGSEHFQGGLDDLRLYQAALTGQQITFLYQAGVAAIQRTARVAEERVSGAYVAAATFAEALAATRRRLLESKLALDLDLAGALTRRLKGSFPREWGNFAGWTGASPLEFLAARGDQFQAQQAARVVDLMLEYQPLTDHQKSKQTPQEADRWARAQGVGERLAALQARGEAARFSPEWVDIILSAGKQVQFRPYLSEPVAPYVKPETPVTRSLTAPEARDALERDWLHQADYNPTPERIKQEIAWARQLADRLEEGGLSKPALTAPRAQLEDLARQAEALKAPDRDLYMRVRQVKRQIVFMNPALDFDKLVFVDMPYPAGSEWAHETRHRLGYMAVPGGRLLVLEGLSPGGKLRQLMPQAPLHGSFWRPDVSFDATRVLFCFKPHNEKSFHLYEMGSDGTGLRQLTDGPYDDLDPIYLPDGRHLLFSTTRGNTYVRCMPPTNAFVLARCERDGKNIYLVSANNEPDYLPSLLHDGRVIYTRWEYTDKPLWRAEKLWTINPDGTNVSVFWGNQSVWPDLMKDARAIPGSRRVMFTGSAHHNWFGGSVAIVDPGRGMNFPAGVTKVTVDMPWPEVGNGPVDPVESPRYHPSGAYASYYSPYPLSERDFLVSANRNGKFVLYLMDVDGNRELIYEGAGNIFHAIPLRPRPAPPVLPDTVTWPDRAHRDQPAEGVIFSANVYQGAPPQLRGKARFLRVLSIDPKTYTYWYKRPYISTGPVVSMVQSDGVKRVLGTVPIEPGGSVAFWAPPGRALHFQLLDGSQRALQTMRSFVGVMPGERRACLGCHEQHSKAPGGGARPQAVANIRRITPPPWGDDTVSFPRYVQPVLDRYCGQCHQGNGRARRTLDLTMRPGFMDFNEPYVTLVGNPSWGAPYQPPSPAPPGFALANTLMVEGFGTADPQAYTTPEPMTRLSYRSRLIDIASSGKHHGVKVDEVSRLRLIAWVDTMCPYFGEEEIRQIPDPVFQGVDWLAVRPRIATAPRIIRPGPVD